MGGGIYGAAVAWDAAQRGLSVALVEREDFGAGASWNSLKTIHGGMRYLQKLDLGRLRQSARERARSARDRAGDRPPAAVRRPDLRPRPDRAGGPRPRPSAQRLADRRPQSGPPFRPAHSRRAARSRRREALRLVPGLERRGLTGAALWHDAQASSTERLTLALLHAAAEAGALAANHAEAVDAPAGRREDRRGRGERHARRPDPRGPRADGRERGRPVGRRRPRPRRACGAPTAPLLRARNVVLRLSPVVPFAVGARSEGRFLFLVPWEGRTIAGTSYEPADAPPSDPMASSTPRPGPSRGRGSSARDATLVHEGLVPGGASPLACRPGPACTTTRRRTGSRDW